MVTTGKPQRQETLAPHDGSLMGNEQVSGRKRTGGVGVGTLYRSRSRVPPSPDRRFSILLNVRWTRPTPTTSRLPSRRGVILLGEEKVLDGRPHLTGVIFMDATRYFAKTTVRFRPGSNCCHALLVRVHVPFSNISPFQISILGSSWNINEEGRRLVEAPPDQVTRISRIQLCYSVRHLQIEVHLRLRRHFERLPEFLLEDFELHRG